MNAHASVPPTMPWRGNRRRSAPSGSAAEEEARSRIEDVDVARAVAESTRDRILGDLSLSGQRIADQSRSRLLDLLN